MYTPDNTRITLLNPNDADWASAIEELYHRLDYPHNASLFPLHFTRVVIPKLGGHIALLQQGEHTLAAGFLFPRNRGDGRRGYTLRFHALAGAPEQETSVLLAALPNLLDDAVEDGKERVEVVLYDPLGHHTYAETHAQLGALDIGRPSQEETLTARQHHQAIWGSPPEMVYPADIHSLEFRLGTSLVSRVDGEVAGFLFGFYKLGGSTLPADWHQRFSGHWRIESQAMGVLPEHRGKHMGYLLKWQQAELARAEGIGVINWTVDPLQYPNAVLNFGLLRGIAFDHYPDLYPFRNELNQVPASRFGITWLVDTERVRALSPTSASATVLELGQEPDVQVLTRGAEVVSDPHSERVAIEIPANWTALQRDDVEAAARWRATTDALFQEHLGLGPNQYVITGVATDAERRYLVAERAGDALWERLGR